MRTRVRMKQKQKQQQQQQKKWVFTFVKFTNINAKANIILRISVSWMCVDDDEHSTNEKPNSRTHILVYTYTIPYVRFVRSSMYYLWA